MRILLVDDDLALLKSLDRGLSAEGYSVKTASDGEEGLQLALGGDFGAIVLDVMMPKRNGFAVVAALRAAGIRTPVLMLTAKDGEFDQTEALDSGADDYVTKPFSYPVLLARLRALIRRAGNQLTAVLSVGDLRVDTGAHQCWRGDTEIDLTPREFALLEALMHSAGEVISKTELYERIWDSVGLADTNVVEVYVGYLRRKIDIPFDRTTLATVRGVGYRLADDQ